VAWTIVGAAAGFLGAVVMTVITLLINDEARGWLDIAPVAILRLAAAHLNREQRERLYYEEWLPELQFIMRETETRPITRTTGFALGLLVAARVVSRLRPSTPPPAVADNAHSASAPRDLMAEQRELVRRTRQLS
jgi:tetrahydromethanopterin S-methyltransferase subunit F